ncbi:MAG: hypothetical protein ABIA75_09140 [Candidatus Neomarinimicrobiota bacterium]
MTDRPDFEQAWQRKFGSALDAVAGPEIRRQIATGNENLSDESTTVEIIEWSCAAMARLDRSLPAITCRAVMTRCACHYPVENLEPIAAYYRNTADLAGAQRLLQAQFESYLRNVLELDATAVDWIVAQGWGAAGIIDGERIIATKIPKSGNLMEYLGNDHRPAGDG